MWCPGTELRLNALATLVWGSDDPLELAYWRGRTLTVVFGGLISRPDVDQAVIRPLFIAIAAETLGKILRRIYERNQKRRILTGSLSVFGG